MNSLDFTNQLLKNFSEQQIAAAKLSDKGDAPDYQQQQNEEEEHEQKS